MSFVRTIARYLLPPASAVVLPIALAGQAQQSPAKAPAALPPMLNEQQRMGDALFHQYCPLCHVPNRRVSKDPESEAAPRVSSLDGRLREGRLSEADARAAILKGIPKRMPGFQYTLGPKELDDLIAFLKIL